MWNLYIYQKAKTMKNQKWTENELRLLEEWDWVKRYIETQYPNQVSEVDKMRYIVLEGKLLIINKLIIFYYNDNSDPEGILSFREYLAECEKTERTDKKLSFHPLNFKNQVQYKNYINHVREEFFALLN